MFLSLFLFEKEILTQVIKGSLVSWLQRFQSLVSWFLCSWVKQIHHDWSMCGRSLLILRHPWSRKAKVEGARNNISCKDTLPFISSYKKISPPCFYYFLTDNPVKFWLHQVFNFIGLWWPTPLILTLGRQGQADTCEF